MRQRCKQCSTAYVWKKHSGSGTLRQHYTSQHPIAWAQWKAQQDDDKEESDLLSVATTAAPASPSIPAKRPAAADCERALPSGSACSSESVKRPKPSTQTTLPFAFASSGRISAARQMALCFATNRIAYNVADNPTFRAFCDAVRLSNSALPSRRALKEETSALADDMRKQVLTRLVNSKSPVGVLLDGWTNVRHTKVTNIVLISSGIAYYWCSIANPYEKNTAAWMHAALLPKLQELLSCGVRFAAFIADNEAVNNALYDLLRAPFPFLVRVPCAAHTIQLVVKQVMGCARWSAVQRTADDILHRFAACKEARSRLRSLQQGEKHEYCLIKPNDTRWNSHMYACERLHLLRRFINIIYPQDDSCWTELQAYVNFLIPFQVATDIVQSDSATLFDVFQQWCKLHQHVKTADEGIVKLSTAALNERWETQVNKPATIASALLSLDVDLVQLKVAAETIEDARRFVVSFGSAYLRFFHMSALSEDDLSGLLRNQLGQFVGRRGRFQQLDEQVRTMKKSAGAQWSAVDVWALYEMELATVATALLTMPASEAAVERSFSAQGAVHSKLRNRLHDITVQQEMFVAFNHSALTQIRENAVRPATVELTADFLAEPESESESDFDEPMAAAEVDAPDTAQLAADSVPAAASSAAAAAAAAAPMRTQSAINDDNHAFLEEYIDANGIHLHMRWNGDRAAHLEAAAIGNNPGGYNTATLKLQIKHILQERSAASTATA